MKHWQLQIKLHSVTPQSTIAEQVYIPRFANLRATPAQHKIKKVVTEAPVAQYVQKHNTLIIVKYCLLPFPGAALQCEPQNPLLQNEISDSHGGDCTLWPHGM